MVVRRVYPSWDRLRFVVFHPESEGAGFHEVPDDEGSAWCEKATDGDVHLIGDVQRRNQVPAAPGGSGLACHDLYGGAEGKVIAFLAEGQPQEFLGIAPQAEEEKSGDEDSR